MRAQEPDLESTDTRHSLLEAGMLEFAEWGIDASVRRICARAGTNPAAVNYHFGTKRKFYAEVLVNCHQRAVARRPMPRLGDEPMRPREVLRRWVRWMLELLLLEGTGTPLGQLMAREMFQPTEAFDELLRRSILPIYQALTEIVEALIGPAGPSALHLCVNSVLGQCLHYKHAANAIPRLRQLARPAGVTPDRDPTARELDALARHIADFSLAGLARRHGNPTETTDESQETAAPLERRGRHDLPGRLRSRA